MSYFFTNNHCKSTKYEVKKAGSINLLSIRKVTPEGGEEKLAELRFKRGSEILAKHEATTHLWKVIVKQGLGDLVLISIYRSFSKD